MIQWLKHSINQHIEPNETILLIIREHIIANLFTFSILGLTYFGLLFFTPVLLRWQWWGVLILGVSLLGILLYVLKTFIVWYLDVMIVTSQRLLDLQRLGLFSKVVQEIPWKQVQQVKYEQRGIRATLFNYGVVVISTTQPGEVRLHHVAQPKQVCNLIAQYVKK